MSMSVCGASQPIRASVSSTAGRSPPDRGRTSITLRPARSFNSSGVPAVIDAAVVDDHDVARQLVGFLEVLRREQDVGAVGDQVPDRTPQVHAATRIEPGGGLVEQQELRPAHQAGAEVETAPHATGVGAHEAVAGVGEIQSLEHLRGGAVAASRRLSPNSRATIRRFSIPGHRRLDRRVLPGETDDLAHALGLGADVDAGDANLATVGPQQRRDRADERGLAGAVRPQERGDVTGLGDQIETVEGVDVAEALRHAVGFDDGCHARSSVRSRRARSVLATLVPVDQSAHVSFGGVGAPLFRHMPATRWAASGR